MKRLFAVLAAICLLSLPALAGDIPTIGAPQPPSATSTDPGEIPSDGSPGQIPSDGLVGDIPTIGLAVILSILGSL